MTTFRTLAGLVFPLFVCASLSAQVTIKRIMIDNGCNFADKPKNAEIIITDPSQQARQIVQEILDHNPFKYKPTIVINAGPVSNAVAMEKNGQRYILYSEAFMESFQKQSLTVQAARFLLAHEVGHHVLQHHFGSKTKFDSHRDELQADDFAARVMARLDASLDETLAGIHTFDQTGETETHPDISAREEVIIVAWKDEVSKRPAQSLPKIPLKLNEAAYKNPWNLINTAQAFIDQEKITITFNVPQQYRSNRFRICLKSSDYAIVPESRTKGAVSGPGSNLPYSDKNTIVWNYKMDRYGQSEAGRSGMLSVYVYDMNNLPRYPSKTLGWATGGAGAACVVWGLAKRAKGLKVYNNEYKVSYSDEDYKKADKDYFGSQFIIGGGAALIGTGVWIMIKKARLTREVSRSMCSKEPAWELAPWVSAEGYGVQAEYRF